MNPDNASLAELIGELVAAGADSTVIAVLQRREQRIFRAVLENRNVDTSSLGASALRDTLAEILNAEQQREFTKRTQGYFTVEGKAAKRLAASIRQMPSSSRELLEKHRDGRSLIELAAERGQTYRATKHALTRIWDRIDRVVADDPDEADLQRFLATGNAADIEPIFKRNKDRITRSLIRGNLARDMGEADAIYNETWVRALNGLKTFRGEAKVATWLTQIARNTAIDAKKKERKHTEHALNLEKAADEYQQFFVSNERPEHNIEATSLFAQLTEGMNDLQIRIIYGRLEGKSVAEMAQENGVAEGTIKSALSRAREIARRNEGDPHEDEPQTPTDKPAPEEMSAADRINLQRNDPRQHQPDDLPPTPGPLGQQNEPGL